METRLEVGIERPFHQLFVRVMVQFRVHRLQHAFRVPGTGHGIVAFPYAGDKMPIWLLFTPHLGPPFLFALRAGANGAGVLSLVPRFSAQ